MKTIPITFTFQAKAGVFSVEIKGRGFYRSVTRFPPPRATKPGTPPRDPHGMKSATLNLLADQKPRLWAEMNREDRNIGRITLEAFKR